MRTKQRPILRYHGGKWKLARWIMGYFPSHRCYTEAYGGGGSVLLQKPRAYAEVYNDLDGEIVNLFRVVRDSGERLRDLLRDTPFAREEYNASFEEAEDPLEQARRTVVRSFMGFGSNSLNRSIKSGFRSNSNRSGTTPAHDWANYPDALDFIRQRLRGVVLENRDAVEVMGRHDAPLTLHYVDPPYVHSTRSVAVAHGHHGYKHEMTDDQHRTLAAELGKMQGGVIVSGYHSELYDELYAGWDHVECKALADGALERTEVLWMRNVRTGLFAGGAS